MTAEDASLPDISVQPEAEIEITEAFRWYEDKNEGLGSEFMRALEASLSSIQRNPTSYAIVHKEMRRVLLRRFPYSVIYLFDSSKIIVLACFHASRDPKQWRDRA
jgi:plasmid stabilization system protein ParE